MNIRKRITAWLLAIAGFLITLLLMSALLAPRLMNLETVKELIEKKISQDTGGTIAYRQLDLSYFPRPHVIIHEVAFTLPTDMTGEMPALQIYPKLLPLIWGKFRVAKLIAEKPEYTIRIGETISGGSAQKDRFTFSGLMHEVHELILSLPEFILSGVDVGLKDGSLNLLKGERRLFGFHDIQAFYTGPSGKTKFNLTCKSNLWHSITVDGWLNTAEFKSQGNIRLAGFRPQSLSDYFFPDSPLKITEALANLIIDFKTNGHDWFEANFEGSIPYLKLTQAKRNLVIKDNTLKGGVRLSKNRATVSLKELSLLYPQLQVFGELIIDQDQSLVSIEMQGQKFDVDAIRKVALEIATDAGIINDIFTVIKGGHIPLVTLSSSGERIADLVDEKNMVIRGQMQKGKIFIPEAKLDLDRVEGGAVISDGILRGKNLKAHMGESVGQNGNLTLGLNEDITPFQLDIMVQADLSQLPPVLNRVVEDQGFLKELSLINNVRGKAAGKLALGYDTKQMNLKVEASEAHFQARYERIPYPLEIDGGTFFLDGLQLAFSNFEVVLGKSLISDTSATLQWKKTTQLQLTAGTAKLDMEEIYPWLVSLGTIQGELRNISSVKGKIRIHDTRLEGPLFQPQAWQIRSRGEFDNLELNSVNLPGRLQVIRGQFNCQGTKVHAENIDAGIGESSFSGVFAEFDWGKEPTVMIQSGPAKIQADELYSWLLTFDELKQRLIEFQPIRGTLVFNTLMMKRPLSGHRSRHLTLHGNLSESVLDVKRFPGSIRIDNGQVSWQHNRLRFNDFSGSFGKSTFRRLSSTLIWGQIATMEAKSKSVVVFLNDIWPWLASSKRIDDRLSDIRVSQGVLRLYDLEIKGPLDRPGEWRLFSTADMQAIVVQSDSLDEPITLTRGKFILTQRDYGGSPHNCIKFGSTHFKWGESNIRLIGDIFFSPNTLAAEMNISLDRMDWNRVKKILDVADHSGPSNIHALLGITSEKFTYHGYVFQPIRVDVSLKPQEVQVAIEKAELCGIALRGIVKVNDQNLEYYVVPNSRNTNLESTLSCLSNQKASASGKFRLEGEIMAKTKPHTPARVYSGNLDFSADDGRIYRFGLLAKIFAILNFTEIYRGEVPDLIGEGFAYHSMNIRANFLGQKLIMEQCALDGPSMGLACEGSIDLAEDTIDLVILVAPFKTMDRIVKKIPLIGSVLGGKIISIPFRAKGKLENPAVIPLSPSAVGSGVLGLMERTLKLPIKIIQPLLPDEKKNEPGNQKP